MRDVQHVLHTLFGFTAFRPGQEQAISSLLDGQHTLVVMPTGAGKSLIYQLTAMCLPQPATTIVISPLIALMKDQVDSLNRRDIPATYINSSQPTGEQSRRMNDVLNGDYRLLYISPERLRNIQFQHTLRRLTIGLLVIDEAHCISHWGHDFRPDYRRIAQARADMGNPLTVALTATATTLVQDDIVELLNIPAAQRVVTGFNRPNLSFEVFYASESASKIHLLKTALQGFNSNNETNADHAPTGAAIIYTGTRRDAEEVAAFVSDGMQLRASYYHAGLESDQRTAIQEAFIKGTLPVVVATNAFGMGIDRADVRMVVHYNMPGTLEAYYQEAGRAGRDGKPARAILLYSPQDRILQQWFIENNAASFDDLQRLYHALAASKEREVQTTMEYLAGMTRLDIAKVRMGLAHLERANIIRQAGDEGTSMHVFLERWDNDAVQTVTASVDAYNRHRQLQLDQITDYAEADSCRRQILLHYFSDHSTAEAERCCDNCFAQQHPPPDPQDAATLSRSERAALVILDTLKRLKYDVGRKRLAEVLKGSQSKTMTQYYRNNAYYGRFAEFLLRDIEEMIEQLVLMGYLKIVGRDIPVLSLSRRGYVALKARAAIPLSLPGARGMSGTSSGAQRDKRHPTVGATAKQTEALFRQGFTPAEIAEKRGLAESTVYNHLSALIGQGHLALSDIVRDEVATQVRAVIAEVGDISKLTPLKERLPDSISFNEIRCVVEDVRREQQK